MTNLQAKISQDLKIALLDRDQLKIDVLRGLRAIILNEEIAQHCREAGLGDQAIEKLVAKEIKKRKDSSVIYESAGRLELVALEQKEVEILEKYLPKQLNKATVEKIIDEIINSHGGIDSGNMGKIISVARSKVGNTFESQKLVALIKDKINN